MKRFALIGHPLGHSFSASYFKEKFEREDRAHECVYENLDVEDLAAALPGLKKAGTYAGFNVTVPYKQAIIPFLDALSPEAEAIGAVNVIKVEEDGRWIGYNTDCIGFTQSLLNFLTGEPPVLPMARGPLVRVPAEGALPPIKGALILGNGGASKAVQYALNQLGISCFVVSRKGGDTPVGHTMPVPSKARGPLVRVPAAGAPSPAAGATSPAAGVLSYNTPLLEKYLAESKLIINTTSLGMWPDTQSKPPIPYHVLTPEHKAFDLVYNPETTAFMTACAARGSAVKNGLEMLHLQAEASWRIWRAGLQPRV